MMIFNQDRRTPQPHRQAGVAMPLVIVAIVAMFAIAGLALDGSHAFVNKTRLQNMVDAAALAAAKVYDQTADTAQGNTAANGIFGLNTDGNGNFEIDSAYDGGDITVTVQWSPTLNPFTPSGIGPYVRVIATGFDMATGLTGVLGITDINITASAVAGPSPAIDNACNIAPIVVCANDMDEDYYGFDPNDLMVLKPTPGDTDDVGPGNYKMLRLECAGGDCLRDAMAGAYDACATTDTDVETEPGVTAGPTAQGFNTRFGEWAGPISPDDYPPDVVVEQPDPPLHHPGADPVTGEDIITQGVGGPVVTTAGDISYNYDNYTYSTTHGVHDFAPGGSPGGVEWRRVLAMPVADCSGDESGQSTLNVEGFACYFMLQKIGAYGGPDKNIFGQFVDGCLAGGAAGPDPGPGKGPYLIQLYKDPDSGDS
jgi:hypothetical protein